MFHIPLLKYLSCHRLNPCCIITSKKQIIGWIKSEETNIRFLDPKTSNTDGARKLKVYPDDGTRGRKFLISVYSGATQTSPCLLSERMLHTSCNSRKVYV